MSGMMKILKKKKLKVHVEVVMYTGSGGQKKNVHSVLKKKITKYSQ